jgi:hypothetical protein
MKKLKKSPTASYLLRQKRRELERLLGRIQSLAGGRLFKFKNQLFGSKELTKELFKYFEGKVSYKFSIGAYRVSIKMQIYPLIDNPTVSCVITKRGKEIITRASVSTVYSKSDNPSLICQDLEIVFGHVIRMLGEYYLYSNSEPGPEPIVSLFDALVKDRAKKEGKIAPKWDNLFAEKVHKMYHGGEVETLRKLLKKKYAEQRQNAISEVLPLLHAKGREFVIYAKAQKRAFDPSMDILEKLEKGIIRGSHSFIIPTSEGAAPVERKVFLFVYESLFYFHANIFFNILEKAGWGGSILVATGNYPTVHQFMDTKQIDFIVQGQLGMWHDKDLYYEELCNRKDAHEWKSKILKCKFGGEEEIEYWADKLSPEKLLKVVNA